MKKNKYIIQTNFQIQIIHLNKRVVSLDGKGILIKLNNKNDLETNLKKIVPKYKKFKHFQFLSSRVSAKKG